MSHSELTIELPDELKRVAARVPELWSADSHLRHADRRGAGVWQVRSAGQMFAVRFREPGEPGALRREFERMSRAAAAGVAPEPVDYDGTEGWLVARWAEGEPLRAGAPSAVMPIATVARACAALHGLDPFGGSVYDLAAALEADLARVAAGDAQLPPGYAVWRERAFELAGRLAAGAVLAPCHNDLFPGNVIASRNSIRLIDWEYAADNDPAFDLAGFAVATLLDRDSVERLVESYAIALMPDSPVIAEGSGRLLVRVRGWMVAAAVAWLPWALVSQTADPRSHAAWVEWARLRYENTTTAFSDRECRELIERCG